MNSSMKRENYFSRFIIIIIILRKSLSIDSCWISHYVLQKVNNAHMGDEQFCR